MFELLGRLGQGIKPAGIEAAGHQIIPCSLRSALKQYRGFDLNKSPVIEEVADELDDPVAQHHILLHLRTSKIEIAIL